MMLFASTGIETWVQFARPFGQATPGLVNAGTSSALCLCVDTPAGKNVELVTGLPPGGAVLALGAPSVSNSTPADAVVSLDMIVLFSNVTLTASSSETPPPSQPATLFTMMLLLTVSANQW